MVADLQINTIDDFDYQGKTVILRVDINSPLDPVTKKIVNDNRINKSIPTLKTLLDQGAKVAILAHQGDTLDYHNLIPLSEHAERLSARLGQTVRYIDDVAGPAAQGAVKALQPGEAVLLGNVRYLTEEVSTFERSVKLSPREMVDCYLVRQLAYLADYYVNDAFAAAHRNAPSMVGFAEVLPTAGGRQLISEVQALYSIMENPQRPSIFVLGGLKISDAFGMIRQVLENGSADRILTGGVTGMIMWIAQGKSFGKQQEQFLKERSLDGFVEPAQAFIEKYGERFVNPVDFAYERNGSRVECSLDELPIDDVLYLDIGSQTISCYKSVIEDAGTIFVNGPMGVYENPLFEQGTRAIWNAVAASPGYSVVGGGDSVNAAAMLVDDAKARFDYICTAGGAMVRFLSGVELPLIKALKKAYRKV
ncbi:MAG: phosphoglycerate kinase [Firmicutes bacterium]|nr:phosphoglycerate kinase [Bacillota bacterium]